MVLEQRIGGGAGQVLEDNESGSCSFPGQELRFLHLLYTSFGVPTFCKIPFSCFYGNFFWYH